MLVLLEGRTQVKGVSNKPVYYFGSLQEDGYIYFNDDRHYRASIPSNETTNPEDIVHPENVQQWYAQTDRWVRSNIFTNLQGVIFDFGDVIQQIDDAANLAQNAYNLADNAQQDATTALANASQALINAASAYSLAQTAFSDAAQADADATDARSKTLDNGDVLLDTVNLLNQVVANMNLYHGTSLSQITATIWTN